MTHDEKGKRLWSTPEIVDVGKVIDTTEVGVDNLRDNTNDQLKTYKKGAEFDEQIVDLEGR